MTRIFLLLFASTLLTNIFVHSKPVDPKKSQEEIRASLITKHNYKDWLAANSRNKKQLTGDLKVPAPFVVSTSLNINNADDNANRRGRSYPDGKGNTIVEGVRLSDDSSDRITYRNGRFINNVFVPADPAASLVLPAETVVSSDSKKSPRVAKMLNDDGEGRSFNPGFGEYYLGGGNPAALDSLAVESRKFERVVAAPRIGYADTSSEGRDYSFKAGNTQKGRPVYYVVEEPADALHADRSPYNFEPADTQDPFSDVVSDFSQSGISQASQSDFVIKEHTYTMCPGCPTFSIPVPIPKASLVDPQQHQKQPKRQHHQHQLTTTDDDDDDTGNVDYQSSKDKNFFARIGDRIASTMKGIQDKTLGIFDPILNSKNSNFLGVSDDNNSIKEKKAEEGGASSSKKSYLPVMLAGAAAAALGGLAFFGSGPSVSTISARKFPESRLLSPEDLETKTQQVLDAVHQVKKKYDKQD